MDLKGSFWEDYVVVLNDVWDYKPSYFKRKIYDLDLNVDIIDNAIVLPSSMDVKLRNMSCNVFNQSNESIKSTHHRRGVDFKTFKMKENLHNHGCGHDYIQVDSDVIYLGWVFPHYGHFLMESMSRLWFLENYNGNAKFLFNFYKNHDVFIKSKQWATQLLEKFGITEENIIYADKKYVMERLIIPSQSMILHSSVNVKAQSYIWSKIKESSGEGNFSKKIYLSRSQLLKDKRKLVNELEIEKIFSSFGFDIIYPEKLNLDQQIEIISQADVVSGPSGSALHNAAFMKEGSLLMSLTTPDFCLLNEVLCCYSAKTRYEIIFGESVGEEGLGEWVIQINELKKILSNHSFINK